MRAQCPLGSGVREGTWAGVSGEGGVEMEMGGRDGDGVGRGGLFVAMDGCTIVQGPPLVVWATTRCRLLRLVVLLLR